MCLMLLCGLTGCGETEPSSTRDGIFTVEQSERGANLFATHCVRCHSIQEFSGPAFATIWVEAPLAALYVRIANTMPLDQPGSLGTTEATAITAHILAENGMPTGSTALHGDLDWLMGIQIDQSN